MLLTILMATFTSGLYIFQEMKIQVIHKCVFLLKPESTPLILLVLLLFTKLLEFFHQPHSLLCAKHCAGY